MLPRNGEKRRRLRDELFAQHASVCGVGFRTSLGAVEVRHREPIRGILRLEGVHVSYKGSSSAIVPSYVVPPSQPPATPEQQRRRPITGGLQLHNFASDLRRGIAPSGINVGTLGCLVRGDQKQVCVLSNNHVLAGENAGHIGDTIMQAGSATYNTQEVIGALRKFEPLVPDSGHPAIAPVHYNRIDAAIADVSVMSSAGYLPHHGLPAPSRTALPIHGDAVYKVGRSSQRTDGVVDVDDLTFGPVSYSVGPCYFEDCFTILGVNGRPFAQPGDSGAIVVKRQTGEVLGLIFAVRGNDTYACRIDHVLALMSCTLT